MPPNKTQSPQRNFPHSRSTQASSKIDKEISKTIQTLKSGFSDYPIREMVEDAQRIGAYLQTQGLKTNQIRKFLDAVKRIKVRQLQLGSQDKTPDAIFIEIETDIVLLKPKLAYAAVRQDSVDSLRTIISSAIDKTNSIQDFERLVQFVEAIISYHKAEGGQ